MLFYTKILPLFQILLERKMVRYRLHLALIGMDTTSSVDALCRLLRAAR